MGRAVTQVPYESLSRERMDEWAEEIRDYLLGRLSKVSRTEALRRPQQTELQHAPICRWWIFDGKRYAPLQGSLRQSWDWVIWQAKRLIETFNPRVRLNDRPDGVVDWGQTLARGLYQVHREYVVRSSGVGLDDREHASLCGWIGWIEQQWSEYAKYLGIKSCPEWPKFAGNVEVTQERLKYWAHTARRSRWPLLHGVVAESLRPVLEPEELDRIPLPSDEASLFELLCLVRVARSVAPPPRELRWLTEENDNEIKLNGTRIYYQQWLGEAQVLGTYEKELASAVQFFGVSVPRRVDLRFEFEAARGNFDGIIIEAKSGTQEYEHTVAQLRAYRAARPPGSRYLIWGVVVGTPGQRDKTLEEFKAWFAATGKEADVWVFSTADAIPIVLSAALGTQVRQESELPAVI